MLRRHFDARAKGRRLIASRFQSSILAWLCALACLCGARVAHSLDTERVIAQLPHVWYENQLPQSTVLAIVQRADGSIWLATYAGLARYSGAGFMPIDQRSEPALRSAAVTALIEDRDGTLWAGTLNGGLYRSRGQHLEAVSLPPQIDSVFGLVQAADGALWLATNAGIARRVGETVTLFADKEGVPGGPYRGMVADRGGDVWIALDGAGVLHWHAGHFEVLTEGLPSNQVYALEVDLAGTVWAGTQHGLVRYAAGRFDADARAASIDGERIYALQKDRDGSLWIAAQDSGLCRLTPRRFECEPGLAGLGNDIVRSLFEDREGSLWIGTTNNGVHRISDSKLVTVTGELASNSIRAVYEDGAGELWFGTDGGGLARYRDHVLVPDEHDKQLISPFMRSIAEDAAGHLWAGSIEGVSRLDPEGAVKNFRLDDGLPGSIVFALAPRRGGGMWAGTSRGLAQIVADRVEPIGVTRGLDIRAIHEAPDGRLWLGLRSGLRCLKDGALDQCGTSGLPNTSVFAFHRTADGALWLGTSQGLMRWRDGRLDAFGDRAGLHGEAVFNILEDDTGHFWLSTNRGIGRLARADLAALDAGKMAAVEPTWFGKSDGMLSSQCNGASQAPSWRAHDGRLWIGTAKGVVQVDAGRMRRNLSAPPVGIERVLVDGKPVDPAVPGDIGPGVDRLEFDYAGMSYVAPEAVRYRYRLEGYDRDWVDAGDRRAAYYTNLPPGHYVFRASASNNDGVWNEAGAERAFSIVPRWYETRWFRIGLAIAGLALIFGIYRFRVWRVRANERVLTREVALRTEALREANAELSRLASLDGLTRIANRGALDRHLAELWEQHALQRWPLALLLCDIDEFKAYNDAYGHLAGDAALIQVAAAVSPLARSPSDLAARYGGEELVLLLSRCDAGEAMAMGQRLLQAVRDLRIAHRSSAVAPHITISVGIAALVPDPERVPEMLIALADEALYRAKAQGRDRVCEYVAA